MLTVCWLATHHVDCLLIGYSPCWLCADWLLIMLTVLIGYSPCWLCADWLLTMLTLCWLATHHVYCVLIGYTYHVADLQLVP